MKIPESVRINGVDYDVQFESRLNDGSSILLGQVDICNCIIRLNPDAQNHQKNCVTLWHEILHALCYNADLNCPMNRKSRLFRHWQRVFIRCCRITAESCLILPIRRRNDP